MPPQQHDRFPNVSPKYMHHHDRPTLADRFPEGPRFNGPPPRDAVPGREIRGNTDSWRGQQWENRPPFELVH